MPEGVPDVEGVPEGESVRVAEPVCEGVADPVALGVGVPDVDAPSDSEAVGVRGGDADLEGVVVMEGVFDWVGVLVKVREDDAVPEVERDWEGVAVAVRVVDGVCVGDTVAEGVGEGLANFHIMLSSSTTTISLLRDSAGEPVTGRGIGTRHIRPPELLRDSSAPVPGPTTSVPTTNWEKHAKCAGVLEVNTSAGARGSVKVHRRSPEDALKAYAREPEGSNTTPLPCFVYTLLGSRFPMLSTVGDARGRPATRLYQRRAPFSSKELRTPPVVPLGDATTTWLAPTGLDPKLVPGTISAAVTVGAGSAAFQLRRPLFRFSDSSASVAGASTLTAPAEVCMMDTPE